jgi:hypothetical protein
MHAREIGTAETFESTNRLHTSTLFLVIESRSTESGSDFRPAF